MQSAKNSVHLIAVGVIQFTLSRLHSSLTYVSQYVRLIVIGRTGLHHSHHLVYRREMLLQFLQIYSMYSLISRAHRD